MSAAPPTSFIPAYVCVHPGARLGSRRWPAQRFAQVASELVDAGYRIVLTGSAQESSLCGELAGVLHQGLAGRQRAAADLAETVLDTVLDLSGKTDLGTLAALIAGARLLICNDTGVSHIAAALGTPSVVICSGADPRRWAPLDQRRHRVVAGAAPCRPCSYVDCPLEGHPCAAAVSPEQVGLLARAQLQVFASNRAAAVALSQEQV